MTDRIFKYEGSTLSEYVRLMAFDNNIRMKSDGEVSHLINTDEFADQWDWEVLEEQADRISLEYREEFCNGEENDVRAIARQFNACYLNRALEQIFDGRLYRVFYHDN